MKIEELKRLASALDPKIKRTEATLARMKGRRSEISDEMAAERQRILAIIKEETF